MQKFVVLVVFLGLLSLPLMAADTPKVEVFGGYEYMHLGNVGDTGLDINANGWDVSATFNANKHFGVAGDFSGNYSSKSGTIGDLGTGTIKPHLFTYTFGPVISMDAGGKFNPFGHFLIGGGHLSASACGTNGSGQSGCESLGSTNGLAMMAGGGLDVKAGKRMAIRLAQFDWVYLHSQGVGLSKNFRYSAGVVFNF